MADAQQAAETVKHFIQEGGYWLPKQSSLQAAEVDFGFNVALWVSIFFFFVVVVPLFVFAWRYRRKSEDELPPPTGHNTALEIGWSVIPLAIVMACFLIGFRGFMHLSVAPAEAYEINVTAAKWFWTFNYPDGVSSAGELVVPKGRPVKLIMSSRDVIHSFWVPEFRTKQDVVPGLYTSLWFEAPEVVETTAECTEYCGKEHSGMLAKVRVLEEADFNKWMDDQRGGGKGPSVEQGKGLYTKYACATCHSLDGAKGTGPTFKGLFGKEEALTSGSVKVDENYLKESILNPTAKVVAGFAPIMPPFKGQLNDAQIESLILFIKEQK